MKEISIVMALVDYLPVVLFLLAAFNIISIVGKKIDKVFLYIFEVGAALVIIAGFLKATYKLLYALNIGDFIWMSNQLFANQALGFLLAGIGLFLGVMRKGSDKVLAALPTMALVAMMITGLCAMDATLVSIASKAKKKNAMICFIISFFMSLCMGYLSSKDFSQASLNWIAQGVNVVGQLLLYLGTRSLKEV